MKFKLFSLLLFSVSSLLTLAPFSTPSASAACVVTDIAAQIAIRGSKNPANQTNNVDIQSADRCLGNTITNTAVQLYEGPGDVEQTRSSSVVGGSTTQIFYAA